MEKTRACRNASATRRTKIESSIGHRPRRATKQRSLPAIEEEPMNGIIYLVGLIVIIMFILSFLGLR